MKYGNQEKILVKTWGCKIHSVYIGKSLTDGEHIVQLVSPNYLGRLMSVALSQISKSTDSI